MIIKRLCFNGLGQFAQRVEIDFSNGANFIKGDNNQGKTTIAAAIVYAITGRTLTGSPFVDDLINDKTKGGEVQLFVDVGGAAYEIYRSRDNKGKTSKSIVLLNGEKVTDSELMQVFGNAEYFMAAFWPPYIHGIEPKKASELLRKLLPPISENEVKAAMNNADNLKSLILSDPAGMAANLRKEIKENLAEIERAKGRIEAYSGIMTKEVPDVSEAPADRLREVTEKIETIRAGIAPIVDTQPLVLHLEQLRGEYLSLKNGIEDLPEFPGATNCPTCGQSLQGDAVDKVAQDYYSRIENIEQRNKAKIERMTVIATLAADKKKMIDEAMRQNEKLSSAIPEDLPQLETERADLQRQCYEAAQAEATRNTILQQKLDAETKKLQAAADVEDHVQVNRTLTLQVEALVEFQATKSRLMMEQIKQYLDKADITLWEIVKSTGEVKPTFELIYDGQPFAGMSNSNRIRCGLEISRLINKITGADYPVYIDNAESITARNDTKEQFFEAYVVNGSPLYVNDDPVN